MTYHERSIDPSGQGYEVIIRKVPRGANRGKRFSQELTITGMLPTDRLVNVNEMSLVKTSQNPDSPASKFLK